MNEDTKDFLRIAAAFGLILSANGIVNGIFYLIGG